MQWWGHSKAHGWVVLDRSIPCNASGTKQDLLFLRCSDSEPFTETRKNWVPPAYSFAPNYLLSLPSAASAEAAAELAGLQARWPEFERKVQQDHRATQARIAADAADEAG